MPSRTENLTFAGYLVRFRPSYTSDPRYLEYCASAAFFQGSIESDAITSTISNFNAERYGNLRVPDRLASTQQAIADFLDTETARIDALITKKRRMLNVLDEWEQRTALSAVGDFREVRTRTLRQYGADVVTGPFGTVLSASEYTDGGVPLINPSHINRGLLFPDPKVSVPQIVANRISRHKLQPGDIVMGRKGDVGRSAIVPIFAEGWICGSDSIAIRCRKGGVHPEFLLAALRLDLYRQQLARSSTGATLTNVNDGVLLDLCLPALDRAAQLIAVRTCEEAWRRRDQLNGRLTTQIALIREHRQALITAAVTGEIDIPGAAA